MPSFTIPKGYSAPDGVKEGTEFSEIATFKFDGKEMMLLSVGEDKTPIAGYEDKAEKAEKSEKPKGAKDAIKEQLGAMEDKGGSAKMEDSEEEMED